jgi:hypothetical protein
MVPDHLLLTPDSRLLTPDYFNRNLPTVRPPSATLIEA